MEFNMKRHSVTTTISTRVRNIINNKERSTHRV